MHAGKESGRGHELFWAGVAHWTHVYGFRLGIIVAALVRFLWLGAPMLSRSGLIFEHTCRTS